jgi:hypothetical protein
MGNFQRRHGGTPRERLQGLDTEDEFRRRSLAADAQAAELLGKFTRVNRQVATVSGSYTWDPAMKYVEVTGTGGGGGGARGGGGGGAARTPLAPRGPLAWALAEDLAPPPAESTAARRSRR